ncbi:MAG: hypothetical protein WCK98_03810 [bacterium]
MSFKEVLIRILKGWWLILIFTLIFTISFYKTTQGKEIYRGSISVGITFDNIFQEQNIRDTPEKTPSLFTSTSSSISQYLLFRFSSVEIQDIVAKKMGFQISDLNNIAPFYRVLDQKAGFVSISYDSESKSDAEKFLDAIKQVYNFLITTELNNNQTNTYKVRPQENLIESITTTQKPSQQKILPSISGFVVGVVISLFWPSALDLINKRRKV